MPLKLPVPRPLAPAEALAVRDLPLGETWGYEPKWDGFRCLAFRNGSAVELQSKAQKSLTRYFPEVTAALLRVGAERFVLDGELVVPRDGGLSFDRLLERIHPAESRVRRLAREAPAGLVAFDLLAEEDESLLARALGCRRERLERFAERYFAEAGSLWLSPFTADPQTARAWLEGAPGIDGVVAKRLDLAYHSGERTAMRKVKRLRTADCVVGGVRYGRVGKTLASLLLGLYGTDGRLHHVGFTSSFDAKQASELMEAVAPLVGPPGFTGASPGGPSRWSRTASSEWTPLRPELVVEVVYDHFAAGRFRHGTRFLRRRPDKAPDQCTFEQVAATGRGPPDLAGFVAGLLPEG